MDIRDMGIVVVEASKNSFTKDNVACPFLHSRSKAPTDLTIPIWCHHCDFPSFVGMGTTSMNSGLVRPYLF
jgi:hypothetical protein